MTGTAAKCYCICYQLCLRPETKWPLTQFFLISSWNFSITRCRVGTGVARHAGKASFAACTAALNSAAVVSGSRETTSWVACEEKLQCASRSQSHAGILHHQRTLSCSLPQKSEERSHNLSAHRGTTEHAESRLSACNFATHHSMGLDLQTGTPVAPCVRELGNGTHRVCNVDPVAAGGVFELPINEQLHFRLQVHSGLV